MLTPNPRVQDLNSSKLGATMKTLQDKQRMFLIAPSIFSLAFIILAAYGAKAQTNTFPSTGNAGVGTPSPATALEVIANEPARGAIRVRNLAKTGLSGIEYERGSDGVVTGYVGLDLTNGFFRLNSINNHPFVFLTESIERMRITSDGNVGIGTSTPPAFRLDVAGDVNTSNPYKIKGATVLSTLGSANVFVGVGAGAANVAGPGPASLDGEEPAPNGSYNSFFGAAAGRANTTGSNNSFFGTFAGSEGLTGSFNSFFGAFAGNGGTQNSGNTHNSVFGATAGRNLTSGKENSFFGVSAGFANTRGVNNSFFGMSAGNGNESGSQNTIIGAGADVGANNLTNATAIGSRAQVNANNSLVLGGITGINGGTNTNVGIGTTRPAFRLDVSGDVNTRTQYKILGRTVLSPIGDNRIILGRPDGQDIIRIPGLGSGTIPLCRDASNDISNCGSSLRYKRDINRFSGGLNVVRQLRPISFRWKADGTPDVGFGAEDVARIAPLFVTHNTAGEIEGVKYSQLTAVLVDAIQEQQAQLEAKEARIAELEARLVALERVVLSELSVVRPRQSTATATTQTKRTQARR